ncbi:MAG: LysE family translocator [Woeseiaceae bacterium]|nr:LysE family translocator [Woeseiaceae bacterium]
METLAALIVATVILVMIPGPNVALIVANTLQYGFRTGATTVLGTTVGVAFQLSFVVAGMAVLVDYAADALAWIRWAGVIYLLWLGIRTWRKPAADLDDSKAVPAMFWRGCMLSAVNPKTLLFNAAFLPQFVTNGSTGSFAVVAAVFLAVLFFGDLVWVLFAGSARKLLARYSRWHNRLTGAFLSTAGVALALAKRA